MVIAAKRHDQVHPLKVFGEEVRRFREEAELSQAQLADKSAISSSHIGKIERGDTRCERTMAVTLDDVLDTRGSLPSLWDKLVKNAAFPEWFDWYEIEADPETLSLVAYEPFVIYGLLQTERYALAQLGGRAPAVEARLNRQIVLHREDPEPPRITALLAETALVNEMGGKDVMREQLEHLLGVTSPRLSIQVVPSPVPPAGTDGSFCMATMADRKELAHVGTPARGFTLSGVKDIETISNKLADIREAALPVGQSRAFIQRILETRWT